MLSFHMTPRSKLLFALRTALVVLAGVNFACSSGSDRSDALQALQPQVPSSVRSYAYITNLGDNTVTTYSRNNNTGALSATGSMPVGNAPDAVVSFHSSHGDFLYVANNADNTISQFRINQTGSLSALTPATVKTGNQPVALLSTTVSVEGFDRVYVANHGDNTITVYHINTDGTLGVTSTLTSGGTGPIKMITDKFHFYVLNGGDNTTTYTPVPDAQGGLQHTSSSKLAANGVPTDMTEPNSVLITDSKNKSLTSYAPSSSWTTETTVSVPNPPVSMALSNPGASLVDQGVFVGSSAGFLYQYRYDIHAIVGPNLVSQQASPIAFPAQPVVLRTWAAGSDCLYVLLTKSDTVQCYPIQNLSLDPASTTSALTGKSPSDIAFAEIIITTGDVQTTVK